MFGHRRRSTDPAATAPAAVALPPPDGNDVNLLRYLRPECICMNLATTQTPAAEDETDGQRERRRAADKERILQELVDLLDQSGEIVNPTKFYKDMVNRERKATTAIAPGLAIPHVRSLQARSFIMGFARAPEPGLHFGSLDGEPTRLFFLLASPPYEDSLYLKVYRQFAEMIRHDWIVASFLTAETPQDVLNVLRGYIVQ
jgi:mannitol/fructose-specific phosphotransferase system IIA component (Ntr-type)